MGVLPTHRRQGLLTKLMRKQLEDAHARGEPIASLFASEGAIYGRFGYGVAALKGEIDLPKAHARLVDEEPPAPASLLENEDEALEVLPPIYDRAREETVGMLSRTADWWRVRRFGGGPAHGGGEQNRVVLELDGETAAYALYSLNFESERFISKTVLDVREAIGATPAALRAIWRYLLSIDWVERIRADFLPLDHPLFFLLDEVRRMDFTVAESLWIRLVDVGAALSARSYAADEAVVLEIADEFCPWNDGRWRLAQGGCERSDADPDLRLTVNELGSVYLGGVAFDQLARAGRIKEIAEGAVARADALFRTPRQPWCPELF